MAEKLGAETPLKFTAPEVVGTFVYKTQHITPWIGNRGKTNIAVSNAGIGGISYVPVAARAFSGFAPGCMLATLAVTSGTALAGSIVQFDPVSTDAGQKVWNGMVIVDQGLTMSPPLFAGATTVQTYFGAVNVATPKTSWMLRKQFLYAGTNPATDSSNTVEVASAVGKAIAASPFLAYQTVISNGSSVTPYVTGTQGNGNGIVNTNPNLPTSGAEVVVTY